MNKSDDTISRQDATTLPFLPKEHREYQTNNLDDAFEYGWMELTKCIESLPSAEPCDKDAISREGLLKSWEELSPRGRTEFDQVIMTIPALPSAEQKTGKWVKVIDEETPNVTKWHYECDQCRTGRYENGQRYCHNCGARMKGGDDE